MAINLTGVFADVGNLASSVSMQDVLGTVMSGAAATVLVSGLKTQAGLDAVDPLQIFHKDGTSSVVGKSITSAAFNALAPAAQAQVLAAGYVIAG